MRRKRGHSRYESWVPMRISLDLDLVSRGFLASTVGSQCSVAKFQLPADLI
uniref:Uncharacterized protein n=1 Tax=Arundo donax TaxID=35708 RepID=A0A0A9C7F9_ARUDO